MEELPSYHWEQKDPLGTGRTLGQQAMSAMGANLKRAVEYLERHHCLDAQGYIRWDSWTISVLQDFSVKEILGAALGGSLKATLFLAERVIQAPEQHISVRVGQMSLEETRAEYLKTAREKGWTEAYAEAMWQGITQKPGELPEAEGHEGA